MPNLSDTGDVSAEIEQILSGSSSKIAFRALCAAIGRASNHEDLVSHCDQRLAAWPAEMREAPWSWVAALDAGFSAPAWPLVKSLAPTSRRPIGADDLEFPDPRSHPEIRGVTHLDLGEYARGQLASLVDSLDHWDNVRAIRIGGLRNETDGEALAALADSAAITRLESLDLDIDGYSIFRPTPGPAWRLRHAGLRVGDLIHVMGCGLVPDLCSVDVCIGSVEEAHELAECTELDRLERLTIRFRCGRNGTFPRSGPYLGNVIEEDDDACHVFFTRANLTSLRSLEITGASGEAGREGLGARGVGAILASGVLRQLTELDVVASPFGDAVVAHLVAGVDPDRIEKLTLADVFATDLTAAAFAEVGAFPRLSHLDLSCNRLREQGAQQLAVDVAMPALEHLDLSGKRAYSPYYDSPDVQPIGDDGATAWAESPNATRLKHLDLSATGLGPDGLVDLMRSDRLQQLAVLDLSHNPMGLWSASFDDAPLWRTLHTLDLTECGLDTSDIAELVSTPAAPQLRSISLAYNSVGSGGARKLAFWPLLPQLWELNLHDNIIDDGGLIALATSRGAQRLLELDLDQDCWNARVREYDYNTRTPAELLDPAAFPSLDSIRLGLIDEYHDVRHTAGLPAHLIDDATSAPTPWPVLVAFVTHLSSKQLWIRSDPGADDDGLETHDFFRDVARFHRKRNDRDFRSNRFTRHDASLAQARDYARQMIDGDTVAAPTTSGGTIHRIGT